MVAGEDEESNDALKYCLVGTKRNLVSWGHEYLRCLAGQIGKVYETRMEKDEDVDDLIGLVD
jgi:26S proteasome regulatory subunit N1